LFYNFGWTALGKHMAGEQIADGAPVIEDWVRSFVEDLGVVRSAATVRAYVSDVRRWVSFCQDREVHPFRVGPRVAIAFIRFERERNYRPDRTVGPRTVVRRLSAIRRWYSYLALQPEETGVQRNPIPAGSAIRTGAGVIYGRPALLRYDKSHPQTLSATEIERFVRHLTATRYRDRAIVWLLTDGGLRINEALQLHLGDINWSKRILAVRATKNKRERRVPVTEEAMVPLSNYVRLERPNTLTHDFIFVNLGRRGFGKQFRYRSWVAICDQARRAAGTPRVHAHAFRHTFATNMAEGGMPLDALQRVLGHRHIDTVMIYNEVRQGRVYREYQEAMAIQNAARRLRGQVEGGHVPFAAG
jgi:integrase/recombinase XerC